MCGACGRAAGVPTPWSEYGLATHGALSLRQTRRDRITILQDRLRPGHRIASIPSGYQVQTATGTTWLATDLRSLLASLDNVCAFHRPLDAALPSTPVSWAALALSIAAHLRLPTVHAVSGRAALGSGAVLRIRACADGSGRTELLRADQADPIGLISHPTADRPSPRPPTARHFVGISND